MKRLKILPSVLMLVLCVGVLCMGIYAASPNSNQITGSITINPANASVNIRAWAEKADGTRSGEITKTNVRNGGEIISFADLDNIANILKLDFGSASTVNDVKPCYIKIEITNNSRTKELGAYISNQAITKVEAEKSDIFTTKAMTNSTKVDATSLEFYKHMGVASDTTSDTATLVLEFKANDFIEEAGTITFNDYYVNIEEYNPNMIGQTLTDTSSGFIKIASTIETTGAQSLSTTLAPRTSITSSTGFRNKTTPNDLWVVVPNGVELIDGNAWGYGAFQGCTALTKISLPNTLTTVNQSGLNASNLVLKTLPENLTKFYTDSFPSSFYTSTTDKGINYKGVLNNPYYFAVSVNDNALSTYTLNERTMSFGSGLFAGCTNLTSLPTIPSGVTELTGGCFEGCTGLTTITIPGNIKKVDWAFGESSTIKNIILEEGVEYFNDVYEDTSVETSFDMDLNSLTIPNSLQYINPRVIFKVDGGYSKICQKINGAYYLVKPNGEPFIGGLDGNPTGNLVIEDGCKQFYFNSTAEQKTSYASLTSIYIPNSVESIIFFDQQDYWNGFPSGAEFPNITVEANGKLNVMLQNSTWTDGEYDREDYSITWYTNADKTGTPVTHITPSTGEITYYPKLVKSN